MKQKTILLTIALLLMASGYVLAHEGMNHDEAAEGKGTMDSKGSMMGGHEAVMGGEESSMGMMGDKGSMMENKEAAMPQDGAMMDDELTEGPVNVGNKICPVSKDKIASVGDGKGFQIEHNGKIYNLCCEMCVKDFQKDPDKYINIINEELEEQEEGQTGAASENTTPMMNHDHGGMMMHDSGDTDQPTGQK